MDSTSSTATSASVADARVELARQRLREYLAAPGRTQRKVAIGVAYSQGAISNFVKGTYNGNEQEVADRVLSFLATADARVRQPAPPPFVETTIAKGVLAVVAQAELAGDIALVLGAPGMGKTQALLEHKRRSKAALVVTANPGTSAALPLVEDIVDQLQITQPGRTLRVQLRAVIAKLRGSGRAVIVDEAQTLNVKALECLRYIHDETGTGLVLSGNLDVHPLLSAQGAGHFAQFFSRIGIKHRVPNEVSAFDVELVARAALPHLTDESLELLQAVTKGWGGSVRHLVRVVVMAMRAAYEKEREVTARDIREAAKLVDPRNEVRA